MSGSFLSAFTDLTNSTSSAVLSEKKKRINEAMRKNYSFWSWLAGKSGKQFLQGGPTITDQILLSVTSQSSTHKPLQEVTYNSVQSGDTWTGRWCFWRTPSLAGEDELEMNVGEHLDGMGRFLAIKDVFFNKMQVQMTDAFNYGASLYWARPDVARMEGSSADLPYSVPTLVNENTNGLPTTGVDAQGGTWTVIQGINPSTTGKTAWANSKYAYKNLVAGDRDNLLYAFKNAQIQLAWTPPVGSGKEDYFDATKIPEYMVFTSAQGILNADRMWRETGYWVNMQDADLTPRFGPWQFVYESQLDTATVFPTGSGGAASTELDMAGTTNAGPRYFILNRNLLKPVFKNGYFMKHETFTPDGNQPDAIRMLIRNKGNLYRTSGQRNAIIYPTADIS